MSEVRFLNFRNITKYPETQIEQFPYSEKTITRQISNNVASRY